jgi:membrane-bound lytic murein transglycosylase B
MRKVEKKLLVTLLSGIFICVCTCTGYSGNSVETEAFQKYGSSMHALITQLRNKGFETENLFRNPEFQIYENIDVFYSESPEKIGEYTYKQALKSGNREEVEWVFENEFEHYKTRIGFDKKKESMPDFIAQYQEQLSQSESLYHIPKEIIAAIIGIESHFGRVVGHHHAFNVYVSMYVKNYRRKFALEQLEELLKFAQKTQKDVFSLNSSYGGAIGCMQFLPYSLNRWFVGDDVYDMGDTIASVANYIAHFQEKNSSLEKALYKYNPNTFYVKAVLELAGFAKIISKSQ